MDNATLAIRIHSDNANHHLWNNNGTWFVHYTLHLPGFTKARVRRSLRTKSLATARRRRNQLIVSLNSIGEGI